MSPRFARAVFHSYPNNNCIITIKTGNGDYFELVALDQYHAETKLHEFVSTNNLILVECAGFNTTRRSVTRQAANSPMANRPVASPIAMSRSSSSPRASYRRC
jgi:hypothetical protein